MFAKLLSDHVVVQYVFILTETDIRLCAVSLFTRVIKTPQTMAV